MKKTILSLIFFVAVFANVGFANENNNDKVSKEVLTTFDQQFQDASNVSWEKLKNVYIVFFTQANTRYAGFYSEDAKQYGLGRIVDKDYLPVPAMNEISGKYRSAKINSVLEFSSEGDEVYYYVDLNTGKTNLILKVYSNGLTEVAKKTKM